MLAEEATSRSTSACKILRELVAAHYSGERLSLPQPRGPASALTRELNRLGNNVNQLVRQAHSARLHLLEADARRLLAKLQSVLAECG
jgi:hypothetical protein